MRYDKKNKTIYYKDFAKFPNQDFGEIGLERPKVSDKYEYLRKGWFYIAWSWFLYYCIAIPILFVVGKLAVGPHIKGRKNLREVKHTGYCVYGNHTHWIDAFTVSVFICNPKRTNILGFPDALTIPVARSLIKSLGFIPVNTDLKGMLKTTKTVLHYLDKNQAVAIFPEAHIWPYYGGFREFVSTSFYYPAKANKPAVPIWTTYRKVFYSRRPRMTIYVGKPIYPIKENDVKQNEIYLCEKSKEFMKEMNRLHPSKEYIKYIEEHAKD